MNESEARGPTFEGILGEDPSSDLAWRPKSVKLEEVEGVGLGANFIASSG